MRLFAIGFTKSSAEDFFGRLKASGARRILDIRLHNDSQLAGFAKRDDLRFFAKALCGMDYAHRTELAPTQAILDGIKKNRWPWAEFDRRFLALMAERCIEALDRAPFDGGCLLCSEDKPHHCHRRLIVESLAEKWGDVEIVHL